MDPPVSTNKRNVASFSDLPTESMNEIFKNFQNDKQSLYYCALVNRYWCQLAIPWLWSQPIFISNSSDSKDESIPPIETYISCLENDTLLELGIPIPSQRPLFQYTTFMKRLDHDGLCAEVVWWLRNGLTREQLQLMRVVRPLSSEVKAILNAVITALYRHFIRNVNLQMIVLKGTGWELDIPNIFSTINDLRPGMSNLRTLCYNIQPRLQKQIYENMLALLELLPNLCKNIEKLEFSMNTIDHNLERVFSNIISSQNNLGKFIFDCEIGPISKVIFALHIHSQSITFIELRNINLRGISLDFLKDCSYLRDLRLYDCKGISSQQLDPIKQSPLKLMTLYLKSPDMDSDVISLIIEVAGTKLQNLFLMITSSLSSNIFNYCPDLKLIYLDFRKKRLVFPILQAIKGLPLEYLAIHCETNPLEFLRDNLPITLKQLEIDVGNFLAEDLAALLKDCQSPLTTIIIHEESQRTLDKYIPILINFALEKNTLQTVGLHFLGSLLSFLPSIQELKKYVKVTNPSEISIQTSHTYLFNE